MATSNRVAAEPGNRPPTPKPVIVSKPISNREAAEPINRPRPVAVVPSKPVAVGKPPPVSNRVAAEPGNRAPAKAPPPPVSVAKKPSTNRIEAEPANAARFASPVKKVPVAQVRAVPPKPGSGPSPTQPPLSRREAAEPIYATPVRVGSSAGVSAATGGGQTGVSRATSAVQERAVALRNEMQDQIDAGTGPAHRRAPGSGGTLRRVALATPEDLEVLLGREARSQAETGGKYFNPVLVEAAAQKYYEHQQKIDKDLRGKIHELDVLALSDKAEDKLKATQILDSPALKKLVAEYKRVNGVDGEPVEGSAVQFWKTYEYMRQRQGEISAATFNKAAKDQQIMMAYAAGNVNLAAEIASKPYKAPNYGRIQERYEDENGALRTRWRPATAQEALQQMRDDVQARYRVAYADKLANLQRIKRYGEDTMGDTSREAIAAGTVVAAQRALGISDSQLQGFEGPKHIERIVDAALLEWDKANRDKLLHGQPSGSRFGYTAAGVAYNNTRAAYEKSLFDVFHTTRRGSLEQAFALPGVREATAGLGAIAATPWAAYRGLTAGHFEIQTPNVDITKFDIGKGGNLGAIFSAKPGTVLGFGVDTSAATVARLKKERDESAAALTAAWNKGDFTAVGEELGRYGSDPFEGSLGNVLANTVGDVSNVIPFNVLKYPVRAQKAIDAAKGGKSLLKAPVLAVKGFLTPETVLRREKYITEELRELAVKKSGQNPISDAVIAQRISDEIKVLPKSEQAIAMEAKLEFLGLTKTPINAQQLRSLVSERLEARAVAEKVPRQTRVERGSAARATREAAAKTKETARTTATKARLAGVSAADAAARVTYDARRAAAQTYRAGLEAGAAAGSWAARNAHLPEMPWLRARETNLLKTYNNPRTSAAVKTRVMDELNDVQGAIVRLDMDDAVKVDIERAEEARWAGEQTVAAHGVDAEQYVESRRIAYNASNDAEVRIEQARDYRARAMAPSVPVDHGVAGVMRYSDFEVVEGLIAQAKRDLMGASQGQFKTGRRGSAGKVPHDTDPDLIAAKKQILQKHGYTIAQYDEARQVLGTSMVKANTTRGLIMSTGGGRAAMVAARDALRPGRAADLLRKVALDSEMRGASPAEIFEEFVVRHTYEGTRALPQPLTPFQKRTLESAFEELTGTPIYHPDVAKTLEKGSITPSFADKASYAEHMREIGEWSPQQTKTFMEGSDVWSIAEEAAFFESRYGRVPEWADGARLEARGFFDNPDAYQAIQRELGGFNAELQTSGLSGKALRDAGTYATHGFKESADWFAARSFAIQRYGKLVSPDGVTLTSMPWLMNKVEYGRYVADLDARGVKLARGLSDPKLADALEASIEKAINKHWETVAKLPPGTVFDSNLFVEVAQDIVNDLLASKDWLNVIGRQRGTLQYRALTTYSTLVRASVVYTVAFLTINMPDTMIKSSYFRLTGRAIMSRAGKEAREWATKIVNPDFTSYYEKSARRGVDRMRAPVNKVDRPLGAAEAILSLPADIGSRLEVNRKRSIASRLWQSAYDDFLPRVGNPELAEAYAARWAKKEIDRMFPTMDGAGPVARLLNEFAPFLNYQFKNSVLWLSEAAAHPALYMRAQELGGVLEEYNRQQWIKENPWDEDGSSMPNKAKGKIPLPGAPDVYFDPTTLSDIGRGLKLLDQKERTLVDNLATSFRAVSPAPLAIARGILDGMRVGGEYKWEKILNSEGFPTGGMRRVWVPLGEPWSGDPVGLESVFWPLDLFNSYNEKAAEGGLDTGDMYQLLGKLTMYSEFARVSPAEMAAAYYVELKGKDEAAAKKFFDEHPEISEYWKSKAKPTDWFVPKEVEGWRKPWDPDRDWWTSKGKDFLTTVKDERAHRAAVDADFDRRIGEMLGDDPFDPKIQELRNAQKFAYLQNTTQNMIEADVLSAKPEDWARRLTQFETDEKIAEYYRMGNMIPKRENFRSDQQFQTAMDSWMLQRSTYLIAHPTVSAVLGSDRSQIQSALDAQREDWDNIFAHTRERTAKAKAAKAHGGEDPDLLYAINELEYMRLEKDTPVFFKSEADLKAEGRATAALGMIGAAPEKFGRAVRAAVLPDYEQNKWNKASPEERIKITAENVQKKADKEYRAAIGGIVEGAKVNGIMDRDKFRAGVLSSPKSVQDAYFKAHPGERERWAADAQYDKKMDAWSAAMTKGDFDKADKIWATLTTAERNRYFQITPHGSEDLMGVGGLKTSQTPKGAVREKKADYRAIIGPWGKAKHEGRYAEADALWARMPKWAKDMYFADPKEGKQRVADYQYGQAMKKWTGYIGAGNWAAANKYFADLPQWMQDKYKAKHPDSGRRQRGQASSAYAAAMGKWVSYLDKDDFAGAQKYFDSLPDSIKNRYYNDPEKGAERRAQRDYGEAMAGWTALIAKGDQEGANAYFDKLPKWVKDKYYGDPEKGAERKQTRDYIGYMEKWSGYMERDDFDGAEAYFDSIPQWAQDRYYNDPVKGAERKRTKEYGEALQRWGELVGAEKFDEADKAFEALPQWMKDRYYSDPEKGAERTRSAAYRDVMGTYAKLLDEGKFDQARDYIDTRPQWMQDKYFKDPEKGAERLQNRQYSDTLGQWGELLKKSDKAEAEKFFDDMPKWMKDKYYNDPEKGAERRLTRDYSKALDPWIAKLDAKDFNGAKAYFDSMPLGYRQMYFAKHPEKRGPGDTYLYGGKGTGGAAKPVVYRAPTAASVRAARAPAPPARTPYVKPTPVKPPKFTNPKPDRPTYPSMPPGKADPDFVDLAKLDAYFKLPMGDQADYLRLNPDIAQYLANSATDDQRYRFAVLNGLRAIPKDEPWLRRIYQERYPDVFSKEAVAEYRRQQTYKDLAEHPEFLPAYEKYYNAINATYAESLHRHGVKPRVEKKQVVPRTRRRRAEGRPAKWTSNRP